MSPHCSTKVTLAVALLTAWLAGALWEPGILLRAQQGYELAADWPQYPPDMEFEMGTGIAVDGDDVIYTISRDVDHWAAHPLAMTRYRGRGTIARWDRDGRFLGRFADDQEFIGPHAMFVDPDGFIWVADREGQQVVKLTPEGEEVLSVGEYGQYGDDSEHFNGPTGVAFLPDGRFVVSVVGNVCGTALHPYVTAPGQIAPERLQPMPNCRSRFDVFTAEGDYVGPYEPVPDPGLPLSVATYGDRVYLSVTGSEQGRQDLLIVDAETGSIVERLVGANVYVHQMAMDSHGDIYVASVHPEHGGQARGAAGPSFVRWKQR